MRRNLSLKHRGDKPVSFARYCLYEDGMLRIIFKRVPNFTDRTVDAAIGIEEDILAPDLLDYLLPRDKLAAALDEEEQDVQRNALQL